MSEANGTLGTRQQSIRRWRRRTYVARFQRAFLFLYL